MNAASNIEDIHRLSELQETMLVHHLQRGSSDTGALCVRCRLIGELDQDRFAQAWVETMARHPAARSSVHWKDLKHPVQVVSREVDVAMDVEDYSSLSKEEQDDRLEDLEHSAVAKALDVSKAPVMRWKVARLSDREHALLWGCHHLLLDGWSSALLLTEVLRRHDALIGDRTLDEPRAPRFRDWVTWLREHDNVDPAAFWHDQPFRLSTPIATANWRTQPYPERAMSMELRASFSAKQLLAFARRARITPASVLLGGWALTLAETTGDPDPVFGFVTSGRGAAFDQIESLVGMLSNALPFAARIDEAARLPEWLAKIASAQRTLLQYERCSLVSLLRAGGYSPRRPLFDTMIAYANYPGDGPRNGSPGKDRSEQLKLGSFESDATSNCSLAVGVSHRSDVRLRALYQPAAVDRSLVQSMLVRFEQIVQGMVSQETHRVGDLVQIERKVSGVQRRDQTPIADVERVRSELPSRASERQLLAIWHALLGVLEIGLDDSFFDLGGDSIQLPMMIDRVRQDFGVELALGAVVECPTIRHLADIIGSGADQHSWRCLVPIRSVGSRPPLYLVHELEGEIRLYHDLANHLPPDQPVFGLQPPAEPLADISAMASRYLGEIRKVQAHGPYHVGGYCLGGIIAYEMARQLSAAGERVAPLVLLDGVAPGPLFTATSALLPSPRMMMRMFAENPRRFTHLAGHRLVRTARGTLRAKDTPVELNDVRDTSIISGLNYETATRNFRAARDYAPEPWEGDAVVLRTVDDRYAHDLGWGTLIRGRMRVDYLPGGHLQTLREPYVQETARRIAALLADPDGFPD